MAKSVRSWGKRPREAIEGQRIDSEADLGRAIGTLAEPPPTISSHISGGRRPSTAPPASPGLRGPRRHRGVAAGVDRQRGRDLRPPPRRRQPLRGPAAAGRAEDAAARRGPVDRQDPGPAGRRRRGRRRTLPLDRLAMPAEEARGPRGRSKRHRALDGADVSSCSASAMPMPGPPATSRSRTRPGWRSGSTRGQAPELAETASAGARTAASRRACCGAITGPSRRAAASA